MSREGVRIRVFWRGDEGTILLWNTDVLTEVQKGRISLKVRGPGDADWRTPATLIPEAKRMRAALADGKTATILIRHDERLAANDPFEAELTFGEPKAQRTARIEVRPPDAGRPVPFTRPVIVELPSGRITYAEPAHLVGIDEGVLTKVADRVADAVALRLKAKEG